jgi:hypothetical protein
MNKMNCNVIQRSVEYQHSTVLTMENKCLATIKQGSSKGERCWRPPSENGYCGIHQVDAIIEKGILEGLHKCSTHRCITMIKDGKYCTVCAEKKEKTKEETIICRAVYTQGTNKGQQCDKKASTPEGFCGKHALRNTIVEAAAGAGRRICDDGKRACKNFTEYEKLKCEECLTKDRITNKERYDEVKDLGNCLGCRCELTELTLGYRKGIQRCELCYTKLQEVECCRVREKRNYKQEYFKNINVYYNQYITGAISRNLKFDLTRDEFTNIVTKPCNYCGTNIENEVNGIDRIDSCIGYTKENSVPACETCNVMKNDLSLEEFIEHIKLIYTHITSSTIPVVKHTAHSGVKTSFIRPREIVEFYRKKKLDEYIGLCIADKRSPAFIRKMREFQTLDLKEIEARDFIKNSLKIETKIVSNIKRQRINRKEMFGYLKFKNVDACVEHYALVHGSPEGFREDIEDLVALWSDDNSINLQEFDRIIIKYQNKRNLTS